MIITLWGPRGGRQESYHTHTHESHARCSSRRERKKKEIHVKKNDEIFFFFYGTSLIAKNNAIV